MVLLDLFVRVLCACVLRRTRRTRWSAGTSARSRSCWNWTPRRTVRRVFSPPNRKTYCTMSLYGFFSHPGIYRCLDGIFSGLFLGLPNEQNENLANLLPLATLIPAGPDPLRVPVGITGVQMAFSLDYSWIIPGVAERATFFLDYSWGFAERATLYNYCRQTCSRLPLYPSRAWPHKLHDDTIQ